MKKNLIFAFIILCLFSCSTGSLTPDQKKQMDEISIAVALSPDLVFHQLKVDKTGIEKRIISTEKWNLPSLLQIEIDEQSKARGFQTQKINLGATQVKEIDQESRKFFKRLFGKTDSALRELAMSVAKSQGAKTLLLVLPTESADYSTYSPGYGLFCKSSLLSPGDAQAYLMIKVELWHLADQSRWLQKTFTPQDVSTPFGKNCLELDGITDDALSKLSQPVFQKLAGSWVSTLLNQFGLTVTEKKSK